MAYDSNEGMDGALQGAAAGSSAGPYGAAIGAALGILKSREDEQKFQRQQIANAMAIRMSPWLHMDAREHNFKPSNAIADVAALGGAGFQQGLKLDAAQNPKTAKTLNLGDGATESVAPAPAAAPASGFGLGVDTRMPDTGALWQLLAQTRAGA